ncbi:helix-turn-helix domain-containing protein [Sphingobium fuliginis]|jgi:transcriptional regulator with XRE-family HTH domain|uniref:helix-turn-helix domain-containing protein n=1 Tax=Sphingobium fuliginis (strain ATCC 27551) TaxID=336203 RepID=UPI0037C87F05
MSNAATEKSAIFAEEGFVVDAQIFLNELMLEKHISRADLAKAMGVSRARITQIFSDECKNFTVRLLARAIHALGEEAFITHRRAFEALRNASREEAPAMSTNNVYSIWSEEASNDDECEDISDLWQYASAA